MLGWNSLFGIAAVCSAACWACSRGQKTLLERFLCTGHSSRMRKTFLISTLPLLLPEGVLAGLDMRISALVYASQNNHCCQWAKQSGSKPSKPGGCTKHTKKATTTSGCALHLEGDFFLLLFWHWNAAFLMREVWQQQRWDVAWSPDSLA